MRKFALFVMFAVGCLGASAQEGKQAQADSQVKSEELNRSKAANEQLNQLLASPAVKQQLERAQEELRRLEVDPEVQRQKAAFERDLRELLNNPEVQRQMSTVQKQLRELERTTQKQEQATRKLEDDLRKRESTADPKPEKGQNQHQ